MDLFSLAAKLTLDSSDYTSGIGKAEGMMSKVADGAKKVGTLMAGTLTAAAGAVAAVTKQAVEAYSQYEQLTGGVETLFKSSIDEAGSAANKVLENAQKAYETAGMSANEYMETVTSFSASLIQATGRGQQTDLEQLKSTLDEEYTATKRSLEDQYKEREQYWKDRMRGVKNKGYKAELEKQRDEELRELKRQNEDTLAEMKRHNKEQLAEAEAANSSSETSEESLQRAADLADIAIRDMSDNANKMGSDMASIQNAYAGFAKQNYTMLDNLKLGYGGTKSEMERLLKDAEKLTGKKYDVSNYADIVEAIHAIQTEMEISGLSYEEAMDAVDRGEMTYEEAVKKMGTTAKEASTTIEGSSKAMKSAWENMLVSFSDPKGDTKKATQNLVRTAKTYFKNIIPVITQAISGIGDFLVEIIPIIAEELPGIIADVAPKLVSAAGKLISSLGKSILTAFKKIKWPSWSDVKAAIKNAWNTIVSGVEGLAKIIFGENVDGSIKWPTWDDIKNALTMAWNAIVDGVKGLAKLIFGENVDGTIKWPTWEEVGEAIGRAWQAIVDGVSNLGTTIGKVIFGENVDGSIKWPTWDEIVAAVQAAWKGIVDGVKGLGKGIGKVIFGQNVDGTIKWPTWADIQKAVETAWQGIIDGVKGLGTAIGKVVFGENVDGTIKWPTWEDIGASIQSAWDDIVAKVKQLPQLIFGEDTVIGKALKDAFDWCQNAIQEIKHFLGLDMNERQGEGLLTYGEVDEAMGLYPLDDPQNESRLEDFYTDLKDKMEKAGFSAAEVAEALEKVKEIKDYAAMYKFLEALTDSKKKSEELKSAVEAIPTDINVTAHINVDDPNGVFSNGRTPLVGNVPWKSHAAGNWNVPYDDYLANLHRGEMVLTASQARQYRDGNGQGFDMSSLVKGIISAIREGMENAQVNAYMDSRKVTKETNRNNANELLAGRFRP